MTLVDDKVSAKSGSYFSGIQTVLGMELRQRMRSRGWYILLGIWFVVIGGVTALTWAGWSMTNSNYGYVPGSTGPGSLIFEVVLAFVLLFALLVSPAFSANAINGDRAGGTLAIIQVTLLRPGQILWGKFLASWIAGIAFLVVSVPFLAVGVILGGLSFGHIAVALLMLIVEVAVVCAIGVGISALANRPLFSIVITYLVVAVLTVGTLIAFSIGSVLTLGDVQANSVYYKNMGVSSTDPTFEKEPADVTDQNNEYACYGPLQAQPATHTERVTWLLSMNPFVVVADAIPYPPRAVDSDFPTGIFEVISQGARSAQAGPSASNQCVDGKISPSYFGQTTPLWPLGLGIQLLAVALVIFLGWRSLRTPARKLPKGTRVA